MTPTGPAAPNGRTALLTANDLAERWQVPKSHVYRLARDGRVPVVRIGRYFRFRVASIEAWELAQEESVPDA
jgi:excisionase family DNA binding protein